ncbi:hypothetical protein IKF94_03415 [Candidatus Saccharibacteria bacterium]|nr:hypothetical protein [Candidatus Saccharibacteria bacterium]
MTIKEKLNSEGSGNRASEWDSLLVDYREFDPDTQKKIRDEFSNIYDMFVNGRINAEKARRYREEVLNSFSASSGRHIGQTAEQSTPEPKPEPTPEATETIEPAKIIEAEELQWDPRLTEEQRLDLLEKGIYEPEGPEYQRALRGFGLGPIKPTPEEEATDALHEEVQRALDPANTGESQTEEDNHEESEDIENNQEESEDIEADKDAEDKEAEKAARIKELEDRKEELKKEKAEKTKEIEELKAELSSREEKRKKINTIRKDIEGLLGKENAEILNDTSPLTIDSIKRYNEWWSGLDKEAKIVVLSIIDKIKKSPGSGHIVGSGVRLWAELNRSLLEAKQ